MKIKTRIKYTEGYLPTPRHRKLRYRQLEDYVDIELREVSKNDTQLAYIINSTKEIIKYNGLLYSKVTKKEPFYCGNSDRNSDNETTLGRLKYSFIGYSTYFGFREEDTRDNMIAKAQGDLNRYILIGNDIWEVTGRLYHDEIVQLSIVDLEGNILFNSYFKPKVKISKGATECNGITMDDVKNAPTWSSKWNEISSILKDKVLIAYNAYFDEKLIRQTCSNHYIQIDFELNRLCAMRYANHKYTYLKNSSKLVDVISYLGMDFDKNNAHEALFDTYACLYIINPDAEVFKKRDLVKKYYDIMLKYDVKNVGYEQRKKEGDRWLRANFGCSQNTLNNITIETSEAIIDKLEKFILKNNLL